MSDQKISTDVVIIGAGIAGLWLHNRLNNMGFNALLLENNAIGSGQTLSSQGIIHGGAKYALNGIFSKATQAIGDMPARWQSCLAGKGDVDLSQVKVLADHQLMWSKQQLSSKMIGFFASKALKSRMQSIAKEQQPSLFQDPRFKGALYRLEEPVLDIPSVLSALSQPWQDRILQLPADGKLSWLTEQNKVKALQINSRIDIEAQHFVFTAGEGNQALLESLGFNKPEMQVRPLQMVLCKARDPQQALPAIYAHSLGSGSKPIATISSHFDKQGNVVWYIGGNIAEKGVNKSLSQLITEAKALLAEILPWYDLPQLDWAGHKVNRAEPKQSNLSRPDTAFIESNNNVHIAWPTKLALAPDLADKLITKLQQDNLSAGVHSDHYCFPRAEIASPLWDKAFK